MKWRKTKNPDVIDQRGASSGGGGLGGGGMPIPGGLGKAGGGVGVVGIIVFLLLQFVVGGGGGGTGGIQFPGQFNAPSSSDEQAPPTGPDAQAEIKDFTTYVFTDVQDFWTQLFQQQGRQYSDAKAVLYSGGVNTGCGSATSAVGPFYCPADSKVYLDLSFYDDMSAQLGAPGDFAWAYVIAHEMGHHIQNLEGTTGKGGPDEGAEGTSVRTELQADCYSGVWANSVLDQGDLEDGDIEEAMTAAQAVGDDRLQQKSGRGVNPDSFTHGTSEQRERWFKTGFDSGDPASCDTFSASDL